MEILRLNNSDAPRACERVLRALPAWFGIEQAVLDYIKGVESLETYAALDRGEVMGLLALKERSPYTAEIYVMGVLEKYHRQGLGRKLVLHAEESLRVRHFEFLTVKTLSPSRECAAYAKTRQFYEAMGFRALEEFKTLWGDANPCLFMGKSLLN